MNAPAQIETPSGKGSGDENFPVGSFLLPRALRPHVATFYAFARAIDDIADNPDASPDEKITRLEIFADAVQHGSNEAGLEKAQAMRTSLDETGITPQHCLDLISAFKQDSVKNRYESWDELIDYCDRSASPVGRYLLDLHGEDPTNYPKSDALCNALQVINHLQDCADDLDELDRNYMPGAWLREAGTTLDALNAKETSPELRAVMDRMVAGIDDLIIVARTLPGALKSRRLALESAVIIRIAERLTDRLRVEDPVATRVELSRMETALCASAGLIRGLFRRRP